MLISSEKKFIFVHNYKVAGSSVTKALGPYADQDYLRQINSFQRILVKMNLLPKHYPAKYPWHITASELKEKMNGKFDNYFKFGFSRNPWDWQVSLYTFMLNTPTHKQHNLIKSMKSFDEYIDWRINKDFELQKKAFYDNEGRCLMDFIGKIEQIDRDFDTICRRIDVSAKIPHVNRSRTDNDYLKYYSQQSINYVYEAFLPDIEAFKYQKPKL